jgi:hypothetical protein
MLGEGAESRLDGQPLGHWDSLSEAPMGKRSFGNRSSTITNEPISKLIISATPKISFPLPPPTPSPPHLPLHPLPSAETFCSTSITVPLRDKAFPSATVAVDSCRFLVRPALPGRRKRGSNVTRDHPPSGFHAILARKVKIPTALPLPPASSPPRALLDPVVDSVLH